MEVFRTERILVRNLQKSDLKDFHELQGNMNVMRFTTGSANTLEQEKKELEEVIQKKKI